MRTSRKNAPSKLRDQDVDRGIERLRSVLHARSLKLSTVREAIARSALTCSGHFSIEDLLAVLRARGVSGAHMATVYRAVPLLIDAGLIQPTMLSRGNGHFYEVAFEREHHDHLVCKSCGAVIEFHSEAMEALQREIAARYDFSVEEHVHELLGRCKRCRAS